MGVEGTEVERGQKGTERERTERERERERRADGEQQGSPSERRYIRAEEFLAFLPASFVIL